MNKFWEFNSHYGPLAGRILIALIFVLSGWAKITGFAGTTAYMASKGMPLGGGIALILGWQARWAALAILLFTIPATLIFHNFWAVDAVQVQDQMIHFMKNLCIIGATLYVMAFGAGPLSMDSRRIDTQASR